jgi:hypothetical protein
MTFAPGLVDRLGVDVVAGRTHDDAAANDREPDCEGRQARLCAGGTGSARPQCGQTAHVVRFAGVDVPELR